ncbi:MAG: hypothetical protein KAU28_01225 [Phycisphaerae bacterium]|nr:hypothetical protein [Phycisphaerae bacterium]
MNRTQPVESSSSPGDSESFWGEPISTYTSEQAEEDGVLVHPFPDRFPNFFLTRSVHNAIESAGDEHAYPQRAIPLIMDAVLIARARPNDHLWTKGLDGNVTGKTVWISRNERGGLTLMFPEDY